MIEWNCFRMDVMKEKKIQLYRFLLVAFSLIFITLFIYIINNYNRFSTYIFRSRNSEFEIEGIINITPYYDIFSLNRVKLIFGDNYANVKVYRYQTTLLIDDNLVIKKGKDVSVYKKEDFEREEPTSFTDILENMGEYIIEKHDYNEQIKTIEKDSEILLIIDYIDADYNIQTIRIPIVIEKSFSNNKMFYSKSSHI